MKGITKILSAEVLADRWQWDETRNPDGRVHFCRVTVGVRLQGTGDPLEADERKAIQAGAVPDIEEAVLKVLAARIPGAKAGSKKIKSDAAEVNSGNTGEKV